MYMDPRFRIPMASAGLAYYLTMTVFPVLILLYAMLGSSYDAAMHLLGYFTEVLPSDAVEYVRRFLEYVSGNSSPEMIVFACSVIVVTASAAIRSLKTTVGLMQGGSRSAGIVPFLASIGTALAFVVMIYLGVAALFFGENLIAFINRYTPYVHLEYYGKSLRFLLLFIVVFVILIILYLMCRGKKHGYSVVPGALIATLALVGVSGFFSFFINRSVKYPVLYSSLSGLIIVIFWLYCCCVCIYVGAIVNIAIGETRKERQLRT